MQYDSKIIEQSAAKLYAKARSIVITYTLAAALVGFVAGSAAVHNETGAAIGALIAGALGFLLGLEKSFSLKLQAQMALCYVQIERNTNKGGSV